MEEALRKIATSPEPDAELADADRTAMTDCEACARIQTRGPGEWKTMCDNCHERVRIRGSRTESMRKMWAWGLKEQAHQALKEP